MQQWWSRNSPTVRWNCLVVMSTLITILMPGCSSNNGLIIAGERYPMSARVVTFKDPGGYNAYLEHRFFAPDEVLPANPASGCNTPKRYAARSPEGLPESTRNRVSNQGYDLAALKEQIRLFVLHFDVCVTSNRCFRVLHDVRGLSVHFLLDVDGTLYQTLDLAERARHAGPANNHSIGIEIAHIGAYPPEKPEWRKYYREVDGHLELVIPESFSPPAGGPFRPASPGPIRGLIHQRLYEMPDYTPEQYATLKELVHTLSDVFPRLKAEVPRDNNGEVRTGVLSEAELAAFEGVIGHFHVTTGKTDPGPALRWDEILQSE